LQERGLNTVYLGAEDDLDETSLKRKLRRGDLYGVVVLGQVDLPFLSTIKKVHQRVVSISASYPGLCQSVLPNEAQSAGLLVSHLVDQGHKHFAWLGGNKLLKQNAVRRAALDDTLRLRGLSIAPENIFDTSGGDRVDGRKAAAAILERKHRRNFPTAWITLNALMARGAINLLMREGWKIPGQLSIATVDATRVCVEEHPEITGANADAEKMGVKAAELLLQMTGNRDETLADVIVPSRLTIRETTGRAP
jgi:LacI family transcriptional regulator